jgi:DNA-binding MarR family transcriptional regulator
MSTAALDAVEVANRLRPVLLHLNRQLRRETHSMGVTAGQVSLLATIHGVPGIGAGDLAAREGMTAPAVCGHVDKLEAQGLVARTRQGGDGDRRRVGLSVTAEGERVLRAVRSRRTAWLASRLRELDGAELAALDAAMAPLRRLIESGA